MDIHRFAHVTGSIMDNDPNVSANDEAALDAEILANINDIRANKGIATIPTTAAPAAAPAPDEGTGTTPPAPAPAIVKTPEQTPPAPAPAAPATAQPAPIDANDKPIVVPAKDKFESEEAFNKRKELAELAQARRDAKTPEEKTALKTKMENVRREYGNLNSIDRTATTSPNGETVTPAPEDPVLAADKARLKALGGMTREDFQEEMHQARHEENVRGTLNSFVDRHPELQDPDTRDVFFDFVDSTYVWKDKSGKELMTVLELARESMFKPSETVQERVIKAAGVQEKVNAMQFPGGTVVTPGLDPAKKQSIAELMTVPGMTEEKALELISD